MTRSGGFAAASGPGAAASKPAAGAASFSAFARQRQAQSGLTPPPAQKAAAEIQSPLNVTQQAMAIGEPLPVVFCRRHSGRPGGALVFPRATEARFATVAAGGTGAFEARYHMVVSEGRLGGIQRRDVRWGECRAGTYSQNYNMRAGNWVPERSINLAVFPNPTSDFLANLPQFPSYTGGGGNYAGLTTLEAGVVGVSSNNFQRGWNVFIRDGMEIDRGRLLDGVVGPSDNIADLVLWCLQRSGRVPDALIDLPSFQAAARFVDVNGLWCNGEFKDSSNLGDWLARILPYFLLRETRVGGKYGLRPLLPTNTDGTIKTTAIEPDWALTENIIIPDSFKPDWIDAATRRVPVLQMIWRQQYSDTEVPFPRTSSIGNAGLGGPTEQHDLSQFATTELHAVRAGVYRSLRRRLCTHTATVKLRPGTQTSTIAEGDIIQLYLQIESDREAPAVWNRFYCVESVGVAWTGEEQLTLSHFPVDSQGRSLLALAVAGVSVSETPLPSQRTGEGCDSSPGFATDTSVPASTTGGTPFRSGNSPTPSQPIPSDPDPTEPDEPAPDNPPEPEPGPDPEDPTDPPSPGPGKPGDAPNESPQCPFGHVANEYHYGWLESWTPDSASGGGSGFISTTYPDVQGPGVRLGYSGPITNPGWTITYTDLDGVTQTISSSNSLLTMFTRVGPAGPCKDSPSEPNPDDPNAPQPPYSYTVKPGDTLWGIAERYYGSGPQWPKIYNANTGTIGPNPNLIQPGQNLTIPAP